MKGATGCGQIISRPLLVSIHAPVKGATPLGGNPLEDAVVSIHAPVKGATVNADLMGMHTGFNPRAREGRDTISRCEGVLWPVSIHAPVKGAT